MHEFEIKPDLDNILRKLYKKDRKLYNQILNKINEIINSEDIGHYKNLRYNLKDSKRVHIGHHVLIFHYDKLYDIIYFEDFDHHKNIYRK